MASILERNKDIKPRTKTRAEYAEDALYREVWEEVNNEKSLAFVKKYSRQLISAATIIIVLAAIIQIGVRIHHTNKLAQALNYETAVNNMDANALQALGKKSKGATADLALFQSYLINGDKEALEYLAKNAKSRDFKDMAKIQLVELNGDNMTPQEVENYLDGLNTKKSPFYYVSRLLIAQKYLAQGDRQNAKKWLDVILNDKNAPESIVATAQTLK